MHTRPQVSRTPVSLLDVSQTLLAAGIKAEAKFDGISLLPLMQDGARIEKRSLLFFGGWHVGVNFTCGIEHRGADGRHFLYAYNCSSAVDELYNLSSDDAVNLIADPEYGQIRDEIVHRLGAALQNDPRWVGYWAEFRVARYLFVAETARRHADVRQTRLKVRGSSCVVRFFNPRVTSSTRP